MNEAEVADLLKKKFGKPISSAKDHLDKAFKSLKKAREIVEETTDYKKKVMFQHLIMTLGFVECMVEHFDKYTTDEQAENQLSKLDPDDIIKYVKETNMDDIKKFPDKWDNKE